MKNKPADSSDALSRFPYLTSLTEVRVWRCIL